MPLMGVGVSTKQAAKLFYGKGDLGMRACMRAACME